MKWLNILGLLGVISGSAFAEGISVKAADPARNCQNCHAQIKSRLHFSDGSSQTLQVDETQLNDSIHGGRLGCSDCHQEKWGNTHPSVESRSVRDFSIKQSETCKRCHFAHYTRQVDGIHFKLLNQGRTDAPTCVDCHGAHDVKDPKNPRVVMNRKCGACHKEVMKTYENSIHGKGLVEANQDHPLCIDCHGAHKIEKSDEMNFRVSVHLVCGKCHGDAERMKKYNLNPNVLSTYLDDFHGMSNQFYQTQGKDGAQAKKYFATCTDCHGAHDVQSLRNKDSAGQVRKKVIKTCVSCHKTGKDWLADAWLSHQKPTRETAHWVWGVKKFYSFLIPLIMAGLLLHILLHLWKLRSNRSKGKQK